MNKKTHVEKGIINKYAGMQVREQDDSLTAIQFTFSQCQRKMNGEISTC